MLNIGFIGVGSISSVHLNYLKSRNDIRIAALSDISTDLVKDKQNSYGGNAYLDYNEMLKKEKLDAVWICTPSDIREAPLIACAELGLPVFCEKPAERSLEKALKIAEKLDNLNAKVQVGYVFRSNQVVKALKEHIKTDKIHLVQSFYGCNVSLSMGLKPWFYEKEISGGALVDQATHNLDLLRCLFGEVKEVVGFAGNPVHAKNAGYSVDEVITLSFRFEQGVLASHTHTWVGDNWRNEIVLSGEKALYRLNPSRKLSVEQNCNDPLKESTDISNDNNTVEQQGSMYADEDSIFLEMIENGNWDKNPSTYRDAIKSLQLTLACDRAITEREIVRIDSI